MRKIDFTEPLSEADEAYVRDRPWLIQDARLRGEEVRFASEEEFTVDSDDEPTGAPGVQVVDRAADDPNQTASEDGDESAEGDDAEAEDDGDEGEEGEVAPYDEWDYAELKTEAGNRGLSKSGSKEQLITRLQENDASSSE